MVVVAEEPSAPPPSVSVVAVEEGQMSAEAAAPQATLEPPVEAVPSGEDVVMVLDEDPTPPPSLGSHDVVMTPASEPSPTVAMTDSLAAAVVLELSPVAEVSGPFPTAEVAETSSAWGAVTVEEVMEVATSWYIDFPGVGVIDLEAPQLPEIVLEVATERMFDEPSIMETIASVSKALHKYERAGGFATAVAVEATGAALEAPAAGMKPTTDAPAPPPASGSRDASLPSRRKLLKLRPPSQRPAWQRLLGEVGSSPPRPVAAGADEGHAIDEPATTVQGRAAPEGTIRAASPEIQEVPETEASLSQAAASGEARALELAYTPWAVISGPATTPRTTRRLRCATPCSVG
jgi:hypothetical protein